MHRIIRTTGHHFRLLVTRRPDETTRSGHRKFNTVFTGSTTEEPHLVGERLVCTGYSYVEREKRERRCQSPFSA